MIDEGTTGVAFEVFYEREYASVLALARVMVRDWEQARDITQEAFFSVWTRWNEIDNPAGWVRTVVANRSRSRWRRLRVERRALVRATGGVTDVDSGSEWDDTEQFWADVRRLLTVRQAQVVALTYIDGLDSPAIAGVLGCSESTVRVHLTRARDRLRSRMGEVL